MDDSRSKVSHESIVKSSRIIPVCGKGNSIAAANQETPREFPSCGSVDNLVTTANVGRPYLQWYILIAGFTVSHCEACPALQLPIQQISFREKPWCGGTYIHMYNAECS